MINEKSGTEVLSAALRLYDGFAPDYDARFEAVSLRSVYDEVAWRTVEPRFPPAPAHIIDVGCGTGRWVERCVAKGYRVTGIEPSPGMQKVLREKFDAATFDLVPDPIETAFVAEGSADAVIAMGSLQYAADPESALRRMVGWLKPGGLVCVHVDGLVALTLELLRIGKTEEAVLRLKAGWGIFSYGDHQAPLHLFDAGRLTALLVSAGLERVEARGLLVTPAALGRERSEAFLAEDFQGFLALEQTLSGSRAMADAGKHVMAWGYRAA